MVGPLDGVRVLELTQMSAGPLAGMTLADLGGEVIKIERPGSGDISRSATPRVGSESFYFLSVNRGKRSVSIDLKSDRGEPFPPVIEHPYFAPVGFYRTGDDGYLRVSIVKPSGTSCVGPSIGPTSRN